MDVFNSIIKEHINIAESILQREDIKEKARLIAEKITEAFNNGGQLLLCGNGGSAADAQHIATEFISKFYLERPALNAEALSVNTSSLTAISNDYGYSRVFKRQVEGKGRKGDIIIGISTSGTSESVLSALEYAKSIGMTTVLFSGSNNKPKDYVDIALNVPSGDTPRIQEMHIMLGHIICFYVEQSLFGGF